MFGAKERQPIISGITIIITSDKRERKITQYLFTQFGPTMTYSRGESSSLFHYINEFGYNEFPKGYMN
jgi:hypothetical protein